MEKINSIIRAYISYIDDGHFFRRPFTWLYSVIAILNILAPLYLLYQAIRGSLFDYPAMFVIGFLILWVVILLVGWFSFQLWWTRRGNINDYSTDGVQFVATPVFSHFIQTTGEWLGTWIGVVGGFAALIAAVFMGDQAYMLSYMIGLPVLQFGWAAVIIMPIYGFMIVVVARFAAELVRALASIANNTRNRGSSL